MRNPVMSNEISPKFDGFKMITKFARLLTRCFLAGEFDPPAADYETVQI